MAKSYGTLQLLDELATIDNANIYEYGEDTLFEHVRDILDVHNMLTQDIMGDFVEMSPVRIARFGADAVTGEMVDVDEYGAADVQKTALAGYDIGVPIRDYQYAIGWTRRYMETRTVAEFAKELTAAQAADIRNLKKRALDALFRATNYTHVDRLVDGINLPVKALQNADGTSIPIDEFGTAFNGATHTHLVGRAGGSLAASDISALITNVTEHGVEGGQLILYIPAGLESAVRAFTSNFDAFQAPLLDPGPGSTADIVDGGRKDDPYQINDKPIGIWDGYVRVWVKPWMPANYIMAFLTESTLRGRVVRMRTRPNSAYGTFRILAQNEHYFPLRAEHMGREFGMGVWNRLGAAILYTGGTSYVQPTISL